MMYSNKVAVCLKVNGKVLREDGENVYLPFGQEYTIFIRNLNSVRALVKIEIDGTDISDGSALVVQANDSLEIERFIKSMDVGQRFKFIERTQKIEEGPRGIKVEDGLIRFEVEFEQPQRHRPIYSKGSGIARSTPGSVHQAGAHYREPLWNSTSISTQNASLIGDTLGDDVPMSVVAASANDVGITVGGSISEQKFYTVGHIQTDGIKHVMILRLLGEVNERKIAKPVTVKTTLTCVTCGSKNSVGSKFCAECGTGLLLA